MTARDISNHLSKRERFDAKGRCMVSGKRPYRGRWIPFTAQYARSRSAAIDQALEGTSLAPGEFVAVLARDWRPERRA